MHGRLLVTFLALVVVLAPAVEAGSKPVAYFLKDGPAVIPGGMPSAPPLPVPVATPQIALTGIGLLEPYDPLLGNIPNSTSPKVRPITPGSDGAYPLQFLTPAGHEHATMLRGYFLVGLFPGQTAVLNGNLTATLYAVAPGESPISVAIASRAVDFNASKLPNATSLMPPNSTDPATILYYELARLSPALLQPASYFLLGPIDMNFTNDTQLALGVRLDQGSSPAPLALGASSSLQFDSIYTPSFVLVPWYAADGPYSPPGSSGGSSASGGPTGSGSRSSSGDSGGGSKGSPGLELVAIVALLGLATLLARRRLN